MKALYIPVGPANLSNLYTSINFIDVDYYFVELLDAVGNVIATSVRYMPRACGDDHVQIHFLNSCGAIDSVGMKLMSVESASNSEKTQKAVSDPFNRSQHGTERFNVKSSETFSAMSADFNEPAMDWLDELLRTPLAWMQFTSDQGEGEGYLPIVISDGKIQKRKDDDRYTYEASIQFQLSHGPINIRN